MPASPSSLIASLSAVPGGLSAPNVASGLPMVLAQVPDPRARRGVRHQLSVVVTAAGCAVVAGARSYIANRRVARGLAHRPVGAVGNQGGPATVRGDDPPAVAG